MVLINTNSIKILEPWGTVNPVVTWLRYVALKHSINHTFNKLTLMQNDKIYPFYNKLFKLYCGTEPRACALLPWADKKSSVQNCEKLLCCGCAKERECCQILEVSDEQCEKKKSVDSGHGPKGMGTKHKLSCMLRPFCHRVALGQHDENYRPTLFPYKRVTDVVTERSSRAFRSKVDWNYYVIEAKILDESH